MHVAVYKTWHEVGPCLPIVGQFALLHLDDAFSVYHYFAIEYLMADYINYMSLITFHKLVFFSTNNACYTIMKFIIMLTSGS